MWKCGANIAVSYKVHFTCIWTFCFYDRSTEERAQLYEEKATTAEAALKAANEKIRALMRQFGVEEPENKPKTPEEAPKEPEKPTSANDVAKTKESSKEKPKEKVAASRSSSRTSVKSKKKWKFFTIMLCTFVLLSEKNMNLKISLHIYITIITYTYCWLSEYFNVYMYFILLLLICFCHKMYIFGLLCNAKKGTCTFWGK